jgi:hypothetical protein
MNIRQRNTLALARAMPESDARVQTSGLRDPITWLVAIMVSMTFLLLLAVIDQHEAREDARICALAKR